MAERARDFKVTAESAVSLASRNVDIESFQSPPSAQDTLWSGGVNSGSVVIPFILLAQPESLLNLES